MMMKDLPRPLEMTLTMTDKVVVVVSTTMFVVFFDSVVVPPGAAAAAVVVDVSRWEKIQSIDSDVRHHDDVC